MTLALGHLVRTSMSESVFGLAAISGTMSVGQPDYVTDANWLFRTPDWVNSSGGLLDSCQSVMML